MAEVFTGDLSQIRLLDILNLLILEGKTGKVTLKKGAALGEIFVENGNITHGATETSQGEEALFLMMTWMIGKFSYTPEVLPDSKTIQRSTEQILHEGVQKVQEWDRIRKVIPSTDVAFRLSSRNGADVVLRPDEWNTVICMNGIKTVGEISRELGVSEIEAAKHLYRLLEAGLIEVTEKPIHPLGRIAGKRFFDIVQQELTLVMGPMAPVIIEDHVADMDERISAFPRNRAAELIEGISMEISDEGKRVDFQKKMLEILKKI
jgi:predicted transcriptional regulator